MTTMASTDRLTVTTRDGTTWKRAGDLLELLPYSASTIQRWTRTGRVRRKNVRGIRYHALVDVLLVALGDGPRTHADERVMHRQFVQRRQDVTRALAKMHREEWCDDDTARLVRYHSAGLTAEEIAIHLGRTMIAITDRLYVLQQFGELPTCEPIERDLGRAIELLNDEERQLLDRQ